MAESSTEEDDAFVAALSGVHRSLGILKMAFGSRRHQVAIESAQRALIILAATVTARGPENAPPG